MQKLLINTMGETTKLRRPATFCCSCSCSRHHMTSSSSALMGLVLLRTTWRRVSMPLHSPSLTTTWGNRTLHTSTASLCWSFIFNEMSMVGRKALAKWTDDCARPSLTTPSKCSEVARAFFSEILASFHQSWICPSTPLTLNLSCQTRGEQPTRPSTKQ